MASLVFLGFLQLIVALPASSSFNCAPLELVIARGTTEPLMPDYGVIVGDPIFEATKALLPNITGYKVDYPASFEKDSKKKGADDVNSRLIASSTACPDQKYVLVGYSQGGDVMHSAAQTMSKDIQKKIVAVVLFGDPGNRGPNVRSPLGGTIPPFPEPLASRLMENCAKEDPVCTNSGMDPNEHLAYRNPKYDYMQQSAEYIKKQFDSDGKAGPLPSPNGGPQDKGDNSKALMELGKMLGGEPTQLTQLAQS